MTNSPFKELDFVRQLTLQAVEGITDHELDHIPDGFNNNIR